MRKLAFPFHFSGAQARRGSWWTFPPAASPGEGVTEVRGLRPLRRTT